MSMHSCITWHCWWFPVLINPNGLIVGDPEFHCDSWFLSSSIEYDLFCIWTVHTAVALAIWREISAFVPTEMVAYDSFLAIPAVLWHFSFRVYECRWFVTWITNNEVMGSLTLTTSRSRMTIPTDIIFLHVSDANQKNNHCFAKYLCDHVSS